MHWYDGGDTSASSRESMILGTAHAGPKGCYLSGEKGKLMAGYYGGKNRLLPEKRFRQFRSASQDAEAHHRALQGVGASMQNRLADQC